MTITDLVDGAFTLYRADLGQMLLAIGAIVVPVQAVAAGFSVQFFGFLATLGEISAEPSPTELFSGLGGFFVATLVGQLLLIIARAAAVRIGAARFFGASERAKAALREALRRFGALLVNRILVALATFAPFVIGIAAVTGAAIQGETILIVLGVVALMAGIAGSVYTFVALVLTVPVLILEGLGPVAAMRRSHQLVSTRWWPVLGRIVIATLAMGLIGGALGFIPQQLGTVLLLFNPIAGAALVAVAAIIVSLVTEPVNNLIALLIYLDQRIRKEGLDLELMQTMERRSG